MGMCLETQGWRGMSGAFRWQWRTNMARQIQLSHFIGARLWRLMFFDQSVSNFRYNTRPCFLAAWHTLFS
jgi:hypothetical protein